MGNKKTSTKIIIKTKFWPRYNFGPKFECLSYEKTEVYFNKPIYVGQAILDLSKTLMFGFHYNYIKSKYGNKAELLFTDTDSLMYQIETDDCYQDIASDVRKRFDTSDYPEKHESSSKF